MTIDEAIKELCVAMNAIGAGQQFELRLGKLVGKFRAHHERDMRDIQIAQLIPHGVDHVCERYGGKKRINQYRASRGRHLLKQVQ